MSNSFSNSSNHQPKKTVEESQLDSSQAKKTVEESAQSQLPRTSFVRKDPLKGKTIGDRDRYLLQTLLGQGGMSKVYQALDTKFGDRVVAIKLMTNCFSNNNQYLVKRFMGEIKAISRLKHPNIIQVFDFGITASEPPLNSAPFYVMEHLEGQTLHSLLSENTQISSNSILKIIIQVIAGLKTAHDKGIIHRDLKPDNIFLIEGGVFGEIVKIIDFGIAKDINVDAQNNTQLTQEGSFVGTYRYASPEQCRGALDIDCRTDIYSLGIILYEAICGKNPYGLDDNLMNISQADWIACHLNVPPQPIAEQSGCAEIPDKLKNAIAKCLAKSPKDRFSNLEELQNALTNFLSTKTRINNDFKIEPKPAKVEVRATPKPTEVEVPPTPQPTEVEVRATPKPTEVEIIENNVLENADTHNNTVISAGRQLKSRRKILRYGGLFFIGILLMSVLTKLFRRASDNLPKPKANNLPKPKLKFEIELVKDILIPFAAEVWSLAISPNGQLIAIGNDRSTIELFDRQTGEFSKVLREHANVIRSLVMTQTGKIVSGDGDGNINIWNRDDSLERRLEGHSASIWSLAVSPNGQTLISSSEDESIRIWNLATGEADEIILSQDTVVYAVAFGPDGQIFASAGKDKVIKIWNAKDLTQLKSLPGHQDVIRAIAISPDGKYLVSGSWDKTVKVWELQSGKLITTFKGHQDRVVTVAISRDSRTVFSGSIDNTIKVWSIENAKLITTLSQHSDWVLTLAASSQENLLVSSGKDRTIKLWQYQFTNIE